MSELHLDYRKTTFLKSVAKPEQLPADEGIEVAFVGRSNSGKSSALNVLTGQKRLARTSKTPGRTQLINLFTIDEGRRLVDLPGYGYAKVPEAVQRQWQRLLEIYVLERRCLQGLVVLMDIRHPLTNFDYMLIEMAGQCQLRLHLLLTKADKLSRGAAMNTKQAVAKAVADLPGEISLQIFSSLTKAGLPELQQVLDEWFSEEQ